MSSAEDLDQNLETPNLEHSMLLNFSNRNSKIPQQNPNAALEPVNETAAQTNITKDSSLVFISLDAIANSIPANNNSTPRIPIGNCPRILTNEFPNTNPIASFPSPKNTTAIPLLAPNLYCPASPPAPWQTGIAPNQQPTKFITPTLIETFVADNSSRSGNRSPDNLHTAITEFKTDKGIWGIAALRNPTFQSSHVIFNTLISDGPNLRSLKIVGSRMKQSIKPSKNTIRAAGIADRILKRVCSLSLRPLLLTSSVLSISNSWLWVP